MGVCTTFTPLGFSEFDTYRPSEIVFSSRATAEKVLNLRTGIYKLEIVGAGGGGGGVWSKNAAYFPGGGSGAAFVGEIMLTEGQYKVRVGTKGSVGGVNYNGSAGSSSYLKSGSNTIAEAGGGGNGIFAGGAGAGGTITTNNSFIVTTNLRTNGKSGDGSHLWSPVPGGASVYGGFGFGGTSTGAADDGFIRLTYLRQSEVA
ncbi:MAG: hypothetical protein PHE89_04170 [Alphaproteobacteria bacterium]|nr:hypothetical protein [Alphaproteobacteria bacterium]